MDMTPAWRLDADFGIGFTIAEPGSARGIQLIISDIQAARAELAQALHRARADHLDAET